MRIKSFSPEDRSYLKMTDLENMFNIYIDKRGNYVYNLNTSLYFQDVGTLDVIALSHSMHWPLISYQLYGTTRLAWLLMKLNDVSAADVFNIRSAGEKIKYIPKQQIEPLISTLGDEM